MREHHGPLDPTQAWRVFTIAFLVLLSLLLLATTAVR